MPVPHEILELIDRFDRHGEDYREGNYNETQLRRDFIDPFFESLGWDVNNRQGYAEAYRDVIHEDAIRIGGQKKAPDYGFYIGESRKFFVEAKRPSVNIKHDVEAAFQLRRYGWSAKLPLSILTNFDEFAVYDCRSLKPGSTDKASTARLLYLGYSEYADRWDEIEAVFSREAVLRGAFDKYAEQSRGRRGTAEVDDAFLAEIESWRKALASNIYLRNPHLTTRELNFAVGVIIDRIIFLRICEDRGIEPEEQLKKLIPGRDIYQELLGIFYRADQKYNSGLFHFEEERERSESADTLTPSLNIDDKVLKDIFKNIYLPQSPYEFSVLPADILGQVYEQFLGKVIHLTAHRAVVEDKPEVRKAGGVYYTPSYIVDYIVRQTVGKLCRGKTAKQVDRLRILDPACGSGSFLISAYQYLLDWYLDYYKQDGAEKHLKRLRKDARDEWRLTTAEKKRILLQNIYGVDIDAQAVEVTKLSLLLKVLEGESEQSLSRQMRLLHERVLPDLGSNIKWGNSLIAPDFYDEAGANDLTDEEVYRVNPFDWEREFSGIMEAGGFDAVIGNPPYVVIGKDIYPDSVLSYLNTYKVAQYKTDLFHLFIQKGIDSLGANGRFGYIVPNQWLSQKFTDKLRRYVLEKTAIQEVVVFEQLVFRDANVHTAILLLEKRKPLARDSIHIRKSGAITVSELENASVEQISQQSWLSNEDYRFETRLIGAVGELIVGLMKQWPSLGHVARASLGCQAYNSSKHTQSQITNRVFHSAFKISDEYLPELAGKDVSRYEINRIRGEWIKYGPWLHDYRTLDWLQGPRILVREIAAKPPYQIHACYVEDTYCNYKTILNVNPSSETDFSMKYLLGLLNSRLVSFLYPYMSNKMVARSFPRLSVEDLRKLPIRNINFSLPADNARHDRMVEMVERMLTLHKQLASARTDQERTMLQRRIEATDAQIDALVYELYGLTQEEIRIVENATA